MLTPQDLNAVLQLLASDRLTLRGNEAIPVAALIQRIAAALKAQSNADSPSPTE